MRFGVWINVFLPGILFSQIHFTASPQIINNKEHFSGSVVGISDMNGDGKDDIIKLEDSKFLSIEYQTAPGQAFRHRVIGQISQFDQWSLAIGDINQDGYNDMVYAANQSAGTVYYSIKSGDSIIYQAELLEGSAQAYSQASNLVDINNDGWLDYFMCNDLGENKIWANHGGKISGQPVQWIDFTTIPPSDKSGNYGSVWSDLDQDGDIDLYIAKCKGGVSDPKDPRRVNSLYLNNGQGGYTEAAAPAGLAIGLQSWMAVTGDSDNDGDQDIFLMNHFANCQLLINNGSGVFTDVTATSGINYTAVGVQSSWVDFDNDGLLDILISGNRHQIYINKGQNKFELLNSSLLGLHQIESFSIGDLNDDGKQDIYASYGLLFNQASHRPDVVWLNTTKNNNHFLKVRLVGTTSNKSAVGTKVTVYSGNYKLTKEVHAGISYGTSHSLDLHFGLGSKTTIDSIAIRWPNKQGESIQKPFIDRTLTVTQGKCFAFDPVLSAGSLPALCKPGDSIVLSSPVNGTYLWSNAATTKSISVKTPGDYQLKLITLDGCTALSNILRIDADPRSAYKIEISDSIICKGAASQLSIQTSKKIVWNTGDTSSSILVAQPGAYFGRITEYCSQVNSDTVHVRLIQPAVSGTKSDTVNLGKMASLAATGPGLAWYEELAGGSPLVSGNIFVTPPLDKTTTYYVQSTLINPGLEVKAGIKDFSGETKFNDTNFSGRLLFDVSEASILKSVKVYADTPGIRQIDLLNSSGQILASKVIRIEAGVTKVDLNFDLPVGDSYALAHNEESAVKIFGSKSPRLYRTDGEIDYPLKSGPINIYGTNAGAGNYYYYYDWEVKYKDKICESERVPVRAVVRTVGIADLTDLPFKVYPNPVKNVLNLEWLDRIPAGKMKFEIYTLHGNKINSIEAGIPGKTQQIKLPDLVAGIYWIKAKSVNLEKVFRITVIP